MLNLGPYSTKEFPNIRVYPTVIDRILEGVAVLLAVAAWGCAIWVYTHAEDKIVANFSLFAAGLGTFCLLLVGSLRISLSAGYVFRYVLRNVMWQCSILWQFALPGY